MTAISSFTPLYGVDAESPLCYLLKIDECNILLDCGWDDRFDEKHLEPLKKVIPDVHAVLLSHADMAHLGALPYAVGKLGLTAPIYCTSPVWRMGQMFMYDAYQSLQKYSFNVFHIDDVDAAFEKCTQLKYSQDFALIDKGEGITITPFAAGHSLGGTVWRITKETEQIIYAVDYNHKRERHLNGTVLETFTRPTALITDAYNVLWEHPPRKDRDRKLVELVMGTLRNKGNVLMPMDTAGRVLELLVCLHAYWEYHKLGKATYSFALFSNVAFNTVDFARSSIEWMSTAISKQFDQSRKNPFAFDNITLCHTKEEFEKLKRPILVLATSETLETSFARTIFMEFAANPANLVLFTNRTPSYTLAHQLMREPTPSTVTFQIRKNVLLTGKELEDHLFKVRLQKEQEELEQKKELEEDSDSDQSIDQEEGAWRRRVKLTPAFPMFPCQEEKRSWDIWGEVINAEDYKVQEKEDMADVSKEESGVAPMDVKEEEKVEEDQPKKTVFESVTIPVRCQIQYIDFEGRSDGRSIRTILEHVNPRKLILVHGSDDAKKALKEYSIRRICKEVSVPSSGQCVEITSETNIYRVNLKDSLTSALNFVKVGDYELAFADGQIKLDYKMSPLPMLQAAPMSLVKGHPAVFLGEVKFSELKLLLNQNGIDAALIDGVLVCCNGAVQLKKVSKTQISLQGALCPEYFRIRTLLYSQYQIL